LGIDFCLHSICTDACHPPVASNSLFHALCVL
jgi:hypothetical protein